MNVSQEVIEKLWSEAIEEALVIWRDRANGITNTTSCPFCEIDELLNEHDDCGCCILINCLSTPYGLWDYWDNTELDAENVASDMVKMLEAYKNGDMKLFTSYLNYWDDDDKVCIFEEDST
jgi:hypothetical protein